MLTCDFLERFSTLKGHILTIAHKIIVWYLQPDFGYWIKACLKAHNTENSCREWGYDIAIYDNIVESLLWSRIGNSTCFFALLISFQRISCFQMSLPKLHVKGKTKQRDYKHHFKWKWQLVYCNWCCLS